MKGEKPGQIRSQKRHSYWVYTRKKKRKARKDAGGTTLHRNVLRQRRVPGGRKGRRGPWRRYPAPQLSDQRDITGVYFSNHGGGSKLGPVPSAPTTEPIQEKGFCTGNTALKRKVAEAILSMGKTRGAARSVHQKTQGDREGC